MSKDYRGPLAWFRRWNFKRVERRRWFRELFESMPATDAALLEGVTALLERGAAEATARRAEAAAREAREEARGEEARREEARREEARREEARNEEARREEAAARGAWQASVDSRLEALVQQVERIADERFPVLRTARPGLLREAELDLVAGLAPWLKPRLAFDVGAHHGVFSEALLEAGFEVHALEPNPTTCQELTRRLGGRPGFKAHQLAAGSVDGEAELGLVRDVTGNFVEASQFSSLSGLAPPPGLVSTGSVRVLVRRLDSLVRELGIVTPSFIKADAEGTDLEVMRGLGALRPAVLQVEFWDEALPFSGPGATNRVANLVAQARQQGLHWHLVVFRRWGDDRAAFYTGRTGSPERSWGNVVFFAELAMYERARQILAAALPEARFVAMSNP
jgi:FkbM family methyltransferase